MPFLVSEKILIIYQTKEERKRNEKENSLVGGELLDGAIPFDSGLYATSKPTDKYHAHDHSTYEYLTYNYPGYDHTTYSATVTGASSTVSRKTKIWRYAKSSRNY